MNNNDSSPLTPEQRSAMVNDALKEFYAKHDGASRHPDAALIEDAQKVNQAIYNTCREVINAANKVSPHYNRTAMAELCMKLHRDALVSWPKDALLRVLAILATEAMMENLDRYAHDISPLSP